MPAPRVSEMDLVSAILSDLASDPSKSTTQQLTDYIKDRQERLSWPSHVIQLCPEITKNDLSQKVKVKTRTLVRLLFEAKGQLDANGITEFVLVTSRTMKKVWERLCYRLFSHVHNWTVIGVNVIDQDASISVQLPREQDLDLNVQNYLRGLKSSKEVMLLRPDIFPQKMFNAGFSTRQGGVSSLAPLASLNLVHTIRKPDPLVVIEENQRRLALAGGFDLETFNVARVEHGIKIWVVEKEAERPDKYDGVVTNTPGVTVAAPGADCCMILLADPISGACGAVHSGWLGTIKGAAHSLLNTMVEEYSTNPSDVLAAIGPSIGAECLTILAEHAESIAGRDSSLSWPHGEDPNLCHIDLVKANALMLEMNGVPSSNIDLSKATCTVCNKDLFFSYRRDGTPFGNQVGFIQRLGLSDTTSNLPFS